jgi:hypothetical protein
MPHPIVNIHGHFMHLDHLPDEYTFNLIKKKKGFGCTESIVRNILSKGFGKSGRFARSVLDENLYRHDGLVDNYIASGEYLPERDIKNALDFLFGKPVGGKYNLPESYKKFIENAAGVYPVMPEADPPAWVKNIRTKRKDRRGINK